MTQERIVPDPAIISAIKQAGAKLKIIQAPAFFVDETLTQTSNMGFKTLAQAVEQLGDKSVVIYGATQLPMEGQAELATLIKGAIVEDINSVVDWETYQKDQGMMKDIDSTQGIPKQ